MQTYWCKPHARASIVLTSSSKSSETQQVMDEGLKRLVNWNIDIISRCLVRIIARREAAVEIRKIPSGKSNIKVEPSGSAMEEVKEIIELPEFDAKVAKHTQNPESIQLDTVVKKQLETYVTAIASMYRKNAFHNFEVSPTHLH